jgi:hypothetical protein
VQPFQLTLYVEGYFTNVWDASCFVALTEKNLEFATARARISTTRVLRIRRRGHVRDQRPAVFGFGLSAGFR